MPLPDLTRYLHAPDAPGVDDAELLRRFAEHRDEAAFELLVWRHGGMVLATCHRVLGRSADADDAFQVTFLALARRAGSIRTGAALPGWLHRTARRAAGKVKVADARRAERIRTEVVEPAVEPSLPDDLAPVLDEEIDRLPEKLRRVFVMCHLEGVTNETAAERLGCPKGTVQSRLARAREQLRDRLTRRGVVVPALLVIAVAAPPVATVAAATARAAVCFVAGLNNPELSPQVVTITQEVLRAMRVTQFRAIALVLALMALAGASLAATLVPSANELPPPVPAPDLAVRLAPVPDVAPAAPRALDLKKHGPPDAFDAQFAMGGSVLVVNGWEHENPFMHSVTTVWDAATGQHLHTHRAKRRSDLSAISPDGKRIAVPGDNEFDLDAEEGKAPVQKVFILDAATGKKLVTLEGASGESIRFGPDGKLLAATGLSDLLVWDAATGKRVFTTKAPDEEHMRQCEFLRDGRLVFLTSAGALRVWDPATKKAQAFGQLAPGQPFAPGPDGTVLTTGEERPRLLNVADGKEVRAFGPADEKFVGSAISPDAETVAAITEAGRVVIWSVATGVEWASFKGPAGQPEFTPDGKYIVVTWAEPTPQPRTKLWCAVLTTDGREVRRERGVGRLNFDPAMRSVAVVTKSIPRFPDGVDISTVSVTIHDAATWLAGPAKKND